MQSTNDFHGPVSVYDDIASNRAPIRVNPNRDIPSIELYTGNDSIYLSSSSNGNMLFFDISRGTVPLFSIGNRSTGGSILSIPNIQDASSYDRVLAYDRDGSIGTLPSIPIQLGGTGISYIIPRGSILMSNGIEYMPLVAGDGISIDVDNGIISSKTHTTGSTIVPTDDINNHIVTYTSTYTGNHTIATIDMGSYRVMNMSIKSTMYRSNTEMGVSSQSFMITSNSHKAYGNNASARNGIGQSNIDISISTINGIVSLSTNLKDGDVWKGYITLVCL